jgi:hypothetical protein
MTLCPCDGSIDEAYNDVIESVEQAMTGNPAKVCAGLRRKMQVFAKNHRFEDAAVIRDRWLALERALNERLVWVALQDAEVIRAHDNRGTAVVINRGALELCSTSESQEPLPQIPSAREDRPPSMARLDEAMLIWKFLSSGTAKLRYVSGVLSLPASRMPDVHSAYATTDPESTGESGRNSTTPSSVTTPSTRTSDRNPPIRIGSKPLTTMTWVPTSASG